MLGWRDERPLAEVIPAADAKALQKAYGYTQCWELLEHYPRTYRMRDTDLDPSGIHEGQIFTVVGTVVCTQVRPAKRQMFIATVREGNQDFDAVFFGSNYAMRMLREGTQVMMLGTIKIYRGIVQLQHPDFYVLGASETQATGSLRSLSQYGSLDKILGDRRYIPIYPATAKMNTWRIMGAIGVILDSLPPIREPLPSTPAGLLSFDDAIRHVHRPDDDGPAQSIRRLKYNEALGIALAMALRRRDAAHHTAPALARVAEKARTTLIDSLPYQLTDGQSQVIDEIGEEIATTHPMNRLLQGEVGSGKTVVALVSMLQAVDAGYQCAMLAPTEVLATQHGRSLQNLLDAAGLNTRVVVLTGSMSVGAKRETLLQIIAGDADIVVGTHAIIQDTVEFYKLGFVVVDEQHRFGVEQRDALRGKTGADDITPHMLVMTATPIPRTIAMTVFGDLAVSTLKELPGGRRPIQSSMVPEAYPAWVARSLARIREEVAAGHQAYVVCPRIDGEGGVLEITEMLSDGPFRDLRVSCLHGRMRGEDKDAVMSSFAAGEIDVLVSTTVIEVGVDVPNATVMLVRESECFGMSQLHQLRGRVGRGGHQSLCLFHTLADPGTPSFERVSEVAATSDGFELAELDLRHRQEGDVLGTNQSGTLRTLKLLNLSQDLAVIERANGDAAALVEKNPERAQELVADIEERSLEYLDKS